MLCPRLDPVLAADDDDDDDDDDDGGAKSKGKGGKGKRSDVEVLAEDVVLALMQMNFVPRLR